METLAFWALVLSIWAYFDMTTANQRERWLGQFFLIICIIGATGFLWDTISKLAARF